MKKRLLAMMTTVLLISGIASVAFAAEAPQDMVKAIDKAKSEEHYDYKNGTLKLYDFQEISADNPDLETSKVQMALAEYKTVRDNIFNIKHKDVVYYDPENGQVLQEAQVASIDEAAKYKKSYEGITGAKVQMGMIILWAIVIPLVIIGLVMYVWEPRQYSTTKFKVANRLFYGFNDSYR